MTGKPYKEVKKIATEINNFLNKGNSGRNRQTLWSAYSR